MVQNEKGLNFFLAFRVCNSCSPVRAVCCTLREMTSLLLGKQTLAPSSKTASPLGKGQGLLEHLGSIHIFFFLEQVKRNF